MRGGRVLLWDGVLLFEVGFDVIMMWGGGLLWGVIGCMGYCE